MSDLILAVQVLPEADPLPLPAEPWMFLFLLFLTFTLHMIAVSLTAGGGVMLAISSFSRSGRLVKMRSFLARFVTISLSFSITLGVAPLLFIQVLYGQLFFTTSILMGWLWLLLLLFLMISYYGIYLYLHRHERSDVILKWAPLVSTVLIFVIALILVMNFKLFYRYHEWAEIYKNSGAGWFVNIDHPQVIPAWLHFVLSALAFGGLLVVVHGWIKRREDKGYSDWAIRWGGVWFVISTLLQFAEGYWFLLALPRELIQTFMFGSLYETTVFMGGVALGAISVLLMIWSAWKKRYGWPVATAMIAIAGSMTLMTLKRAATRDFLLKDLRSFDILSMTVSTQWDTLAIFAVLLVIGIAVVAWMLFQLAKGRKQPPDIIDQ